MLNGLKCRGAIAFALALCLSVAAMPASVNVKAAQPITVYVNGQEVQFDKQPEVVNDRVVVQIRAIAEKLGCSVVWDDVNQISYINQPGTSLVQNGVKGKDIQVYVNNVKVEFPDQQPLMMNDYVMIPSRPVVEKLGCAIDWYNDTQTQVITSQGAKPYIPTPGAQPPTPSVKPSPTQAPKPTSAVTPAPQQNLSVVYWTPGGGSYHSTPDCPTLARSKTIKSGTIAEAKAAGKDDPCNVCIKQ